MIELPLVERDAGGSASQWRAELHLRYERDGHRTVLRERRHVGPLVVQKSLYPEGDAVCQNIVVHPPGGIAGGDTLLLDARVDAGAHAQLTTPGAAKWYRSGVGAAVARQNVMLNVGLGGALEWLPQENIVFNGASASLETSIDLAADARFIGWDIVCLGRTASGERFERGELRTQLAVHRGGTLAFAERLRLQGGSRLLDSPAGLSGHPIFGTFLAAATDVSVSMLATCREVTVSDGEAAATRLPGLIVARYRGASSESARAYFAALWTRLRPLLMGRDAVHPRIWKT